MRSRSRGERECRVAGGRRPRARPAACARTGPGAGDRGPPAPGLGESCQTCLSVRSGRASGTAGPMAGERTVAAGRPEPTRDYLILTVAPASSSSFLSFAASSLEMPVLISLGADSTRSLASLRPRLGGRAHHLDDVDLVGADRLEHHVELGLRRGGLGRGGGGGAGHHTGRGGGLQAVGFLQVLGELEDLQDLHVDQRVAQALDVIGERSRGFRGGHRRMDPFMRSSGNRESIVNRSDRRCAVRTAGPARAGRATVRVVIGPGGGRLAVAGRRPRRRPRPAASPGVAARRALLLLDEGLELADQRAGRRGHQRQHLRAGASSRLSTWPIRTSRLGSLVMSSTCSGPTTTPSTAPP